MDFEAEVEIVTITMVIPQQPVQREERKVGILVCGGASSEVKG